MEPTIRLPIDKAWAGFCNKFAELQKQGRTIAESDRYRITLDASSAGAHLMVFDKKDDSEPEYDETVLSKQRFEDELTYLYDFYMTEPVDDDIPHDFDDFDDEDELAYEPHGVSGLNGDVIDEFIAQISPGASVLDPFYEDMREDLRLSAEDVLLKWGFPVAI